MAKRQKLFCVEEVLAKLFNEDELGSMNASCSHESSVEDDLVYNQESDIESDVDDTLSEKAYSSDDDNDNDVNFEVENLKSSQDSVISDKVQFVIQEPSQSKPI